MRDRHAVSGAQAAEVPTLHAARPALAGRSARHVDKLTNNEMIRRDLYTNRNEIGLIDPKFSEFALRLDLGHSKVAAVRTIGALHLAQAGAELQRNVAVLVLGARADNLAIAEAQHRHRHMFASFGEEPHHTDLLRQHSRTHCLIPSRLTA